MMKSLRFPGFLAAPLALAALITFAACHRGDSTADTTVTPPPFSAKLVKAADPVDLEKHLKAELTRRYERLYESFIYLSNGGGVVLPPSPAGEPQSSNPTSDSASADTSYSTTNVQEKGVDEGDLVKTDGAYIYLARGMHFFILKANPAQETALVSDIDFKEPINELHLAGNLVTVITYSYSHPVMGAPAPFIGGYGPLTRVYTYDVTTAPTPTLTASFDFPGVLQGSRRINNTIYLVTNYNIDIPSPVYPHAFLNGWSYSSDEFRAACAKMREENLRQIEEATLDQLLPVYTKTLYTGGIAGSPSTSPAVSHTDVYIPEFGNGTDLALVIGLNLSSQVPTVASSSLLSAWGGIYISPESLHIASGNSWFWIKPMVNVGMPQGNPEPRTAVHKFAIDGTTGKPFYRGSGIVDGWLNDRFSMSDYQGHLRIGTTRGGWWGEGISNQLTVLAEGSDGLVSKGVITGIAPGERIYSMRFDRDRGYMVTFRQTDPLFTFDLSDPANPRLMGEIQVSGFATYIHLLGPDNTRLLTIGRSTNGWLGGNKLQLFDVSDMASPTLLDSYDLGQGWSDALYDPHAFLYYEPLGILTIPYFSSALDANGFSTYTSGLNVFDIGPASISLPRVISAPTFTTGYGYSYNDSVDRAVIISSSTSTAGNIFAVAHRSVTVADAAQLNVIKQVILPESYSYGPIAIAAAMGTVKTGK